DVIDVAVYREPVAVLLVVVQGELRRVLEPSAGTSERGRRSERRKHVLHQAPLGDQAPDERVGVVAGVEALRNTPQRARHRGGESRLAAHVDECALAAVALRAEQVPERGSVVILLDQVRRARAGSGLDDETALLRVRRDVVAGEGDTHLEQALCNQPLELLAVVELLASPRAEEQPIRGRTAGGALLQEGAERRDARSAGEHHDRASRI